MSLAFFKVHLLRKKEEQLDTFKPKEELAGQRVMLSVSVSDPAGATDSTLYAMDVNSQNDAVTVTGNVYEAFSGEPAADGTVVKVKTLSGKEFKGLTVGGKFEIDPNKYPYMLSIKGNAETFGSETMVYVDFSKDVQDLGKFYVIKALPLESSIYYNIKELLFDLSNTYEQYLIKRQNSKFNVYIDRSGLSSIDDKIEEVKKQMSEINEKLGTIVYEKVDNANDAMLLVKLFEGEGVNDINYMVLEKDSFGAVSKAVFELNIEAKNFNQLVSKGFATDFLAPLQKVRIAYI
ncbi:MAG TPA: hypothetical protein ENF54_04010 [Desulfobacteraceae bacterium]|nr:hypothetical protein [Desulfobacteraceae bacterium]